MTASLRPMNLGEILDRTFQIYRAKFLVFVGISALPALAMLGLRFANQLWWKVTPPYSISLIFGLTVGQIGFALAVYHFSLLFQILVWPSFVGLASRTNLGDQPKIDSALFWQIARWRNLLLMTFLLWGATLVLPELAGASMFLGITYLMSEVAKASSSTMEAVLPSLLIIFILLSCVAALAVSAVSSFAFPAWGLEGLSAGKALRRSWRLSKGTQLRIVFVRILMPILGWLLNYLLVLLPFLLLSILLKGFGGQWFFSRHYLGINFLAAAAASTLVGPIFPIALTLFYYDQRIRHEGYDIERMMDAAGLNAPATSPSAEAPAPTAEAVEEQV